MITELKQGTGLEPQGLLDMGGTHRVLFNFNPPFSLMLLNPEGNRSRTRKAIRFWIERLIILVRGTRFWGDLVSEVLAESSSSYEILGL